MLARICSINVSLKVKTTSQRFGNNCQLIKKYDRQRVMYGSNITPVKTFLMTNYWIKSNNKKYWVNACVGDFSTWQLRRIFFKRFDKSAHLLSFFVTAVFRTEYKKMMRLIYNQPLQTFINFRFKIGEIIRNSFI